jgi:hypothetical protein
MDYNVNIKTLCKTLLIGLMAAVALTVSADTDFTDGNHLSPTNTTTDSLITTSDNWDGGLPTGGSNPGTISIDADASDSISVDGYDVTHDGGNLDTVGNTNLTFGTGTTWVQSGGNIVGTRGLNVNGATYTLNSGTTNLTENNRDSIVQSAGSVTINDGVYQVGRHQFLAGGDFTVNGGTVTISNHLGSRNFHSGGSLSLNGGTISAEFLTYGTGGLNLSFGGATAGSLTIANFDGNRHDVDNIGIDFLSGTLMSMTLTNPVESGDNTDGDIGWMNVGDETGRDWAEQLWFDGRLTFGGADSSTLGNWTSVTSAGGLGGGESFDFDGNTLSVIPEPSTLALLGLAGLAALFFRRRSD